MANQSANINQMASDRDQDEWMRNLEDGNELTCFLGLLATGVGSGLGFMNES